MYGLLFLDATMLLEDLRARLLCRCLFQKRNLKTPLWRTSLQQITGIDRPSAAIIAYNIQAAYVLSAVSRWFIAFCLVCSRTRRVAHADR